MFKLTLRCVAGPYVEIGYATISTYANGGYSGETSGRMSLESDVRNRHESVLAAYLEENEIQA